MELLWPEGICNNAACWVIYDIIFILEIQTQLNLYDLDILEYSELLK